METDPRLNWHSYLDSHALISGQLNSLLKSVKVPERYYNLSKISGSDVLNKRIRSSSHKKLMLCNNFRSTMTGSNLRRYTALPLCLSADRDEELVRVTEQRVGTFSHDLVPNYLRTKPEPEGN